MKNSIVLFTLSFALVSLNAMENHIEIKNNNEKKDLIEKLTFLKAQDYEKPKKTIFGFLCCCKTEREAYTNEISAPFGDYSVNAIDYSGLKIQDFRKHIENIYKLFNPYCLTNEQLKFKDSLEITKLVLNDNMLSSLPNELGELRIKEIRLRKNCFKNPSVLEKWRHTLESVDLSLNSITEFAQIGGTPLSKFKKLRYIDLEGNPITVLPMKELSKMSLNNRTSVFVSGNFELDAENYKTAQNVFPLMNKNRDNSSLGFLIRGLWIEKMQETIEHETIKNNGKTYQQIKDGVEEQ